MTLDPFYSAPLIVQLHIVAALPSMIIGPFALFRDKRDRLHKILGYVWVCAMAALAVTGLFIPSEAAVIAHFGPIHLFSLFTLWGLGEALYQVKRGNTAAHRATMRGVWFGAMGLAGLFTFVPGRRMNQIVFGEAEALGWVFIVIGLLGLGWLWLRQRSRLAQTT